MDPEPRAVILVEGTSDQRALHALARRLDRDLASEEVEVVAMGGAQAIGRYLDLYGPRGMNVRLAGLCDLQEEADFRRGLERAGLGSDLSRLGFFVCDRDLEEELIRAHGADEVLRIAEERGDLSAFKTLQKQPQWNGRPVEEQLRRWLGSGGRRKTRYAEYLVEELELSRMPRPLRGVLDAALG